MRLRVSDRILVAVAGLLLIAICAGMIAQLFFGVDVAGVAVRAFSSESPRVRWALTALAAFLLLLGLYCLFVLFRHRKRKDKFILQKNDGGELAISINALENMVQKCLDQQENISVKKVYLENRKDGLLIRLDGSVAGGISIPLTVEALQKQIRQYVTACSGVEIKGIRVQIEASGEDAENAPFAIAAPISRPLLKEAEEKTASHQNDDAAPAVLPQNPQETEPVQTQAPVQESAIPRPEPVIIDDDDDRPLHQRLFSAQPENCIVPEPPAGPEATVFPEDSVKPETAVPTADAPSVQEEKQPVDSKDAAPVSGSETDQQVSSDETADGGDPEEKPEEDPVRTETDGAGEDFLSSLSAFDAVVTGGKEQGK